jgi:hypothetical protein
MADETVVKTNSKEVKRRAANKNAPPKRVTVADLKDVPKDNLGRVDANAEVTLEEAAKMGALDPQSALTNEMLRRTANGEKLSYGVQHGSEGWDICVQLMKLKGTWPNGRVDVKSIRPEENYPPINDLTAVESGAHMYEYLSRLYSKDQRVTIQLKYYGDSDLRLTCEFVLPARQQQPAAPQQSYGQPPWHSQPWQQPQYPAPGFPPSPGAGYAYPPQQPQAPQQQQQPPAPPALPPQAVQQGMTAQEVGQMLQQQQAWMMQFADYMRQQQPQQPAAPAAPAQPQQPTVIEQMGAFTSMFQGMILPLLRANGTVPDPAAAPAPPKSLLEQVKDLGAIVALGKEMWGSGDAKVDEGMITVLDGPGGTKIPINKESGDMPKGLAMIMGLGSLAEKIETAVKPVAAMRMAQMQQEMERQKQLNQPVQQQQQHQLPSGLPTGLPQTDDDNDPLG